MPRVLALDLLLEHDFRVESVPGGGHRAPFCVLRSQALGGMRLKVYALPRP